MAATTAIAEGDSEMGGVNPVQAAKLAGFFPLRSFPRYTMLSMLAFAAQAATAAALAVAALALAAVAVAAFSLLLSLSLNPSNSIPYLVVGVVVIFPLFGRVAAVAIVGLRLRYLVKRKIGRALVNSMRLGCLLLRNVVAGE